MPGSKPQPPKSPDIGESMREGIDAYVETLPSVIDVQTKYQPKLTDAAITDARSKYFAGKQMEADAMRKYSDDIMGEAIALERRYGPTVAKQYIENMRAAAPGFFKVRDAYEEEVSKDLALGNQLSPEQIRMVQQGVRSGQNARGNIRGVAPTAEEAMRTFLAGESMRDKRMNRAQQYAASPAPGVSFGASPSALAMYQGQPMPQVGGEMFTTNQGLNAGGTGINMAQDVYGRQYGTYERQAKDWKPMWLGILQGGMQGGQMGGQMSGGNPWAIAGGAILGGVAGGAGSQSRA
jgi:hypothetical protein